MYIDNENEIEILAPAGSYDAFVAAVNAGAHAVYMGVSKFNARTMASNLRIDEYISAIDYAHKRNVKVYLTLNTLLFDNEIEEALEIVVKLYNVGLDAVIVQDIGIATLIHKLMPDLALHASTQMSTLNLDQVKYLEALGFTRVVLGRELSVDEIRAIAQRTNLEIEIFVHGALCVSVSGQCMASSLIGDRSANRGSCAQPCRMRYSLYAKDKHTPIIFNRYILSKKDIFGLDKLQELKEAGVKSFKIEGRNRTIEYTAGVVKRYKEALDNNFEISQNVEKELLQLFNRSGKSDGYLNGIRYKNSISHLSPKNTGLVLGKVLAREKEYIKIRLEECIDLHDGVEILNEEVNVPFVVTCIKDERGKIINKKCGKGTVIYLGDVKGKIDIGDIVYKTSSKELNEFSREYITKKENNKRLKYDVEVLIKKGINICAKECLTGVEVSLKYVPEDSKTSGVTLDKIKEVFSKTEDTSVEFTNIMGNIDNKLFVPVSKLNELRRNLVEAIQNSKCTKRNLEIDKVKELLKEENRTKQSGAKKNIINKKTTAIYMYKYNKETDYIELCKQKFGAKLDKLYVTARDFKAYENDIMKYILNENIDVFFVIPNVVLNNMEKYIKQNIERLINIGIKGIVVGNMGYIKLCKDLKEKYDISLVGDYSLNITNRYTAKEFDFFDNITPLFETELVDLEKIENIANIEIVEGLATAMTTRYCIIASFVCDVKQKGQCKTQCKKDEYYIVDDYGKKYNVIPDNTDCITELVRNKRKYSDEYRKRNSVRYNIL